MLSKAGPANWLAFLGVAFGSILIGMGFTKSFETMAICRALLGATEAGFLPGKLDTWLGLVHLRLIFRFRLHLPYFLLV
jgi:hypothetical protein